MKNGQRSRWAHVIAALLARSTHVLFLVELWYIVFFLKNSKILVPEFVRPTEFWIFCHLPNQTFWGNNNVIFSCTFVYFKILLLLKLDRMQKSVEIYLSAWIGRLKINIDSNFFGSICTICILKIISMVFHMLSIFINVRSSNLEKLSVPVSCNIDKL